MFPPPLSPDDCATYELSQCFQSHITHTHTRAQHCTNGHHHRRRGHMQGSIMIIDILVTYQGREPSPAGIAAKGLSVALSSIILYHTGSYEAWKSNIAFHGSISANGDRASGASAAPHRLMGRGRYKTKISLCFISNYLPEAPHQHGAEEPNTLRAAAAPAWLAALHIPAWSAASRWPQKPSLNTSHSASSRSPRRPGSASFRVCQLPPPRGPAAARARCRVLRACEGVRAWSALAFPTSGGFWCLRHVLRAEAGLSEKACSRSSSSELLRLPRMSGC